MAKTDIKSKKGFTIIEVVLVLAIAGLIFLMVFIALPALQSAQRNTQREDALARILTSVTDYQSNNSGRLPFDSSTTIDSFVKRYIDDGCVVTSTPYTGCGDQFTDPDGTIYSFSAKAPTLSDTADVSAGLTGTTNDHVIYYVLNAKCGELEGMVRKGTGTRQVALLMMMEGGAITCNDNS